MPLRRFSEAEVVLKARRSLEGPLLTMVWLAMAMVSLGEGNVYIVAAGTLPVALNLLAAMGGKEIYLPRVVIYLLAFVGTGVVAVESLRPGASPGLDDPLMLKAITHFIVVILLCKLFERKSNRDYVQMLTLSGLIVLSASLLYEQLWYALLSVGYVALMGYVGMVLTLKCGLDRAARERLPGESAPPPPAQVAWNTLRDWPGRAIRRRLVSVLLFMVACGALLFTAAPRLKDVVEPLTSQGLQAIGGLTESVRLGQAKTVYLSDRIAMRVRIHSDDPAILQRQAVQYLCASLASRYERSSWRPEKTREDGGFPLPESVRGGAVILDVSMRMDVLPFLPACWPIVDVETDSGDWRMIPSETAQLELFAPQVHHVRYRAYSWVSPLSADQRSYLTRRRAQTGFFPDAPPPPPPVPPRVTGLANQWCEDLLAQRRADPRRRDELDLAIARRISQRLEEAYPYSLDLSAADPSRDAVEDFLFHMKRGHCEYFASALTVMCQALGVRAQLATGYRTEEISPQTGEMIVRDRDAHAWCMVYTPSTDFVIVDPSPRRAETPTRKGWLARVGAWWRHIQFRWYEQVIGYDTRRREKLGEYLRERLLAGVDWARGRVQWIGASLWNLFLHGTMDAALIRLTEVVLATTGLIASLVLARSAHHRWRLRRAYRTGRAAPTVQAAFMRRLLQLLRRKGLPVRPDRTVRETLHDAVDRFGLPVDAVTEVLDFYYRLRWGRRPARPEELLPILRRVDELARLIRP